MSKALEALRGIKDSLTQDGDILEYTPEYKIIENELEKMEIAKLRVTEYTAEYTAYYINLVLMKDLIISDRWPLCIVARNTFECDAYIDAINSAIYERNYILGFRIFRYRDRICGPVLFVPDNFEPADQISKIVGLYEMQQLDILSKEELDRMFVSKKEEENKNDL